MAYGKTETPQLIFIPEKLMLTEKKRTIELEDEKWFLRANCFITPRGNIKYVEITEKKSKIFSLQIEAIGVFNLEGILSDEDFEEDSEEWYDEGEEYEEAFHDYTQKDVQCMLLMSGKDDTKLVVVLYDAEYQPFAMITGRLEKDNIDAQDLKGYAEWLKNMAWISRVFYGEEE